MPEVADPAVDIQEGVDQERAVLDDADAPILLDGEEATAAVAGVGDEVRVDQAGDHFDPGVAGRVRQLRAAGAEVSFSGTAMVASAEVGSAVSAVAEVTGSAVPCSATALGSVVAAWLQAAVARATTRRAVSGF